MINTINIIILVFWLISALADYLQLTYYWQLKEWRWDRAKDFLSTIQGRQLIFQRRISLRIILIIVALFLPFNLLIFKFSIIFILTLDFLNAFYKFYSRKLLHPVFTKKALLILLFTFCLEGGLFLKSHDWEILLFLLMIRAFLLGFVIYFVNLFTILVKKYYIKKATKKIEKQKNLIVVGITGSYGKTTVKNFLYHVLEKKFKVIKTPRNINTEIGVAKFILKNDFKNSEIFICEMGAYNEGDIQAICDMVHPKIGILTAINEQHLSLFGDIKITQKTKYELLKSLPGNGLAIINSDNNLCRGLIHELNCEVHTFGYNEEYKPTFLLKNIKSTNQGILCEGIFSNQTIIIEASIVGEHNFMNIAPCYLVAKFLKMSDDDIIKSCKILSMPDGSFHIKNYGLAIIINDSYNSNPDGFKAALGVMQKYSSQKRRIVITRGMLELGGNSEELHECIGEEISLVAEELVIITRDNEEALRKGVGTKYKTEIKSIFDPTDLLSYFRSLKDKECVILLENRMPIDIIKELEK